MSLLYSNSLSRVVGNACEGIEDALRKVSHKQSRRALVEYFHLENFAEIVDLHLNPLDYENFEVHNYIGFTQQVQTEILQGLLSGNHPVVCARRCGIPQTKLESWMKLGQQGIQPFAGFFTECLKASGEALAAQMRTALEGGTASKAAIWWLRVTEPELYGDKEVTKTTVTNLTQVNNFMELKPQERFQRIQQVQISDQDLKGYILNRNTVIDHES